MPPPTRFASPAVAAAWLSLRRGPPPWSAIITTQIRSGTARRAHVTVLSALDSALAATPPLPPPPGPAGGISPVGPFRFLSRFVLLLPCLPLTCPLAVSPRVSFSPPPVLIMFPIVLLILLHTTTSPFRSPCGPRSTLLVLPYSLTRVQALAIAKAPSTGVGPGGQKQQQQQQYQAFAYHSIRIPQHDQGAARAQ
jgi:hypothetical protein